MMQVKNFLAKSNFIHLRAKSFPIKHRIRKHSPIYLNFNLGQLQELVYQVQPQRKMYMFANDVGIIVSSFLLSTNDLAFSATI